MSPAAAPGTSAYGTVTRIASDGVHCSSTGTVPGAWADSSISITPNGQSVTCPIVNHAFPAMTPAASLQGFNTVGSTILACRSVKTSAAVNHYGNLVSGAELAGRHGTETADRLREGQRRRPAAHGNLGQGLRSV